MEFEINLNFSKQGSGSNWEDDPNQNYGSSREEENFLKAQKQMRLAQDITVNISNELNRHTSSFDKIINTVSF
jgi:hypothetical protein